ncbi:MAG: pyruvate kinase [Candidatus Polarisedimenticolaceae bacterium]|nr:pyruvate kinase [Candidatus Polarisedimenticolaceae bacterium]
MPRRTKIVATLGPATDQPGVLEALLKTGADLVRINFSHGKPGEHKRRVDRVRQWAANNNKEIGIMGDLQGPKIRTGKFKDGAVVLNKGARFVLDADHSLEGGDIDRVGITYRDLPGDVAVNDILLLDDGAISLRVRRVDGVQIHCQVHVGGKLSDNKGINRQGGGLSAPALTEKDRHDIKLAADLGVDYLAISFVRNAEDVHEARSLLHEAGSNAGLVAKIERADALDVVEEIIEAADAIMVARGDLGVEIGDAKLPEVQKRLIKQAIEMNKAVITATQMMESMIEKPTPTRAEVFDVANAVIDGTDAVMLSAETAAGNYPVKAVHSMANICREAEKHATLRQSSHRLNTVFGRVDESIAMATMYTANHLKVNAIAALTESGFTVRLMSRISSGIPIYAMTRHTATCRRVTLFRGVYPVSFDTGDSHPEEVNRDLINELIEREAVAKDDLIIITKGDRSGVEGQTNLMKVMRVSDHAHRSKE